MTHELIIAGFGGQGVMVMGQLLAYSGMLESKEVSWIQSYGPEMRGGTANCSVVLSDEPIGSPLVNEPSCLIAMNRPSLDKFEPIIRPGGLLIYNSSLIDRKPSRTDICVVAVPANDIAGELGNSRVANMVVVGALIAATGVVKVESILESLKKVLPPHRHDLIPLNREAIERGMACKGECQTA